jgi:hypothetical protein
MAETFEQPELGILFYIILFILRLPILKDMNGPQTP